ncbi:MAG: hypothetical protein FJ095_08470 [Deltaproteobacteria bacterium]|nr:hypothetical protein [Deltaproteobacteria bacterium]
MSPGSTAGARIRSSTRSTTYVSGAVKANAIPASARARARLGYQPVGNAPWTGLPMTKLPGGFGALIPCNDVAAAGTLRLYVEVTDENGKPIAQAGSASNPIEVSIEATPEGKPPAFPGQAPPRSCAPPKCAPGMPGCRESSSAAAAPPLHGWGESCAGSRDCKPGLACVDGSCEKDGVSGRNDVPAVEDEPESFAEKPTGAKTFPLPNHLVTAGVQVDVLLARTADDVCGALEPASGGVSMLDDYACFRSDGTGEFLGKPLPGQSNQLQGGAASGGARLLVGYDFNLRRASEALRGFVVWARVGASLGGSPGLGSAADRFYECTNTFPDADGTTPDVYEGFCRENRAKDFMPFHAELQLKWFPLERLLPASGLHTPRPYLVTGFGVGQVDGGVAVSLCDTVDEGGLPLDPAAPSASDAAICGTSPPAVRREGLEAYQVTGRNFIPLGVGAIFPVHEHVGINIELKGMWMFPQNGFVLAPFIGPVGMF